MSKEKRRSQSFNTEVFGRTIFWFRCWSRRFPACPCISFFRFPRLKIGKNVFTLDANQTLLRFDSHRVQPKSGLFIWIKLEIPDETGQVPNKSCKILHGNTQTENGHGDQRGEQPGSKLKIQKKNA